MTINLKPVLQLATSHAKGTAILVAITIASAGFAGWLHEHDVRIRDSVRLTDSLAVLDTAVRHASARADSLDRARAATADTIMVVNTIVKHDSIRVATALPRLDSTLASLPDTLRTHADTANAIGALPIIRQQADSVSQACHAYETSCAEFRRVTAYQLMLDAASIRARDSVIAGLRAENRIIPKLDATKPPSKWSTVERWGERLAIACGAYALGAHHVCWR